MTASVSEPTFSIGAVAGVVAGAAAGSRFKSEFRCEACDYARELRRQMLGAAGMGIGGVLAVGCTVGQGLSAFSMLSASAPVAIIAIMVGARAGLYVLVEGAALSRRRSFASRPPPAGASRPGSERVGRNRQGRGEHRGGDNQGIQQVGHFVPRSKQCRSTGVGSIGAR